MEYKKYRRTSIVEMRDLMPGETRLRLSADGVDIKTDDLFMSNESLAKGKIARNPEKPDEKWFVSENCFNKNYELLKQKTKRPQRTSTINEEEAIKRLKEAFDGMPKTLRIYAIDKNVCVCKKGISCDVFSEDVYNNIDPGAVLSDVHDDMDFGRV